MPILGIATFRSLGFAVAAGLTLWASPALAATASINYPYTAVSPRGVGTTVGLAVLLPASGTSGFALNFVLPRDYRNNGTVQIVLQLSSANFVCAAQLVPVQVQRRRPGLTATFSVAGLAALDGSPTVNFLSNAVVEKIFTVKPAAGFPGQRRGDSLTVQLNREADAAADTCAGIVSLHAIDIRYPLE